MGTIDILQIVDAKGNPYPAVHTSSIWIENQARTTFAPKTMGNKIQPFITAKDYFADLIAVCDAATKEIYIAGWQVNWDAQLAPSCRLYDLLYRCAKRGVHVYVMPWESTVPIQTYAQQTKVALESINQRLKQEKTKGQGQVTVLLSSSYATTNAKFYSHHQKQVVVDRNIAYVGGIDLCYGRFDDAAYTLQANADGRTMLNRYNPGIPALFAVPPDSAKLVNPDLMTGPLDNVPKQFRIIDGNMVVSDSLATRQMKHIAGGGWQVAYAAAGPIDTIVNAKITASNKADYHMLDAARQPRMPWQDAHCRIEGPAVSDLLRNFITRWNIDNYNKLPLAPAPDSFAAVGKAHIQVLRSAPANQCKKERASGQMVFDLSERKQPVDTTQHELQDAMKRLIAKATRFIYIESQFFVSAFGKLGGPTGGFSSAAQYIKEGPNKLSDTTLKGLRFATTGNAAQMDQMPQNGVLEALLERLKEIIFLDITKPKFHVIITLPVHPEGSLADPTIAVQVYFTMQTLVFGSRSLINGVKRLIKARELVDQGKSRDDPEVKAIFDDDSKAHNDVPEAAWKQYLTLLNLRNWDKLGDRYVTEQIYVHTKLMIIDDRFALLGSANINDRSLLGERDSEIGVLVQDDDATRVDIFGSGVKQPVRTFAHEMRKQIWSKLFGIGQSGREATNLQKAIDEPGNPESWKLIQEQADKNAAIYEAAFPFVPRNFVKDEKDGVTYASILPTWGKKVNHNIETGELVSPMPFQERFWEVRQHTADAEHLSKVKGFITTLPIEWTKGENIWFKYPTSLIVQNEKMPMGNEIRDNVSVAMTSSTDSEGHV